MSSKKKATLFNISVKENGSTLGDANYNEYYFSQSEPDKLFDLLYERKPDVLKWEKMEFYLMDHDFFEYECFQQKDQRKEYWKKKLRHVQQLMEKDQENPTAVCHCGIILFMRSARASTSATPRTIGAPFQNSIPVKVTVYKEDMSKPYLELSNTFHFTDQKPDALYLYIMHNTPGVSVDTWRNFTYTVGNKTIGDNIHATGDLRTVARWYAQLMAIQKTLKQKQDENKEYKCGICLTIQKAEAHTTKARAASQGKVTFSTAPTLTADLHQLLSDLHQIDYSQDRQRQR